MITSTGTANPSSVDVKVAATKRPYWTSVGILVFVYLVTYGAIICSINYFESEDEPELNVDEEGVVVPPVTAENGEDGEVIITAPLDPLSIAFYSNLIGSVVIFICALFLGNTKINIPYWALVPPVLVWYWWSNYFDDDEPETYALLVTIFVFCLRHLFSYFRTWSGIDLVDERLEEWKANLSNPILRWIFVFFWYFIGTAIIQTAGLAPLYSSFAVVELETEALFWIGLIIANAGTIVQLIASEQYCPYKTQKKEGVLDEGLWRYSRHPGYFGEVLFWWGLYFAALGADSDLWWTGAGALAIHLIIELYLIPKAESHLLKTKPAYEKRVATVSRLFPWIRKADKEGEGVQLIQKV